MRWDHHGQLKPAGPADWYKAKSQSFSSRCPFSPTAPDEDAIAEQRFGSAPYQDEKIGRFEAAYVGHVAEAAFREQGSSGGMVSWVAAELLRTSLVDGVAHVAAPSDTRDRFFEYRISHNPAELMNGAKSRYYPIELSKVIQHIRETPGRYAVIGVPCFIKAIHLLRRSDPMIAERVTHTLGLFCGHMKSKHMVESFAWQLGTELSQIAALDYRAKDPSRPANWYRAHFLLRDGSSAAQDWWHLADGDWGAGFFQYSACNFCDDVVAETADIAFGDAWIEPYSSDGRGTNVVIVRTPELHRLIESAIADGRLSLNGVDAPFIEQTQAAGFRHRREGLAYRLTWRRRGPKPIKRVAPGAGSLSLRRRSIYRMRAAITWWSHRVFAVARAAHAPSFYLAWARLSLSAYQAITYSRGRLGRLIDTIERRIGVPDR